MKKYETVIHIVTKGKDVYDAGERAGQFLTDRLSQEKDFYIYCDSTKPYVINQVVTSKSLA